MRMAADIAIPTGRTPPATLPPAAANPRGADVAKRKPADDDDTMEFPVIGRVRGVSRLFATSPAQILAAGAVVLFWFGGQWAGPNLLKPAVDSFIKLPETLHAVTQTLAEISAANRLIIEKWAATAPQQKINEELLRTNIEQVRLLREEISQHPRKD